MDIFDECTAKIVLLFSLSAIWGLHPLSIGWLAALSFAAILIDLRNAGKI